MKKSEPIKQARNQATLETSVRKLSALYDAAPFALALATPVEGALHDVNQAWLDLTGFARKEEVIGKTSLELGLVPDPDQRERIFNEFRERGLVRNAEMTIKDQAGRLRTVLVHLDPVDMGGSTFILSTHHDITDRKQTEESLRKSEAKYQTLFTSISEAFALKEAVLGSEGKIVDFRFIEVNPAFERQSGLSEVVGKTMLDLMPNIGQQWIERFAEVANTGRPARFQDRAGGLDRWFEVFASRVGEGAGPRVAVLFMDITERKRAEETLRKANEELRRRAEEALTQRQRFFDMLEILPVMVRMMTPDYHVAFANRAFRQKFGEAHGRHCYEYCCGYERPCEFCESFVPLKTGRPHHWEFTSPDGKTITDAYDFPFTDTDGSQAILEMDIDITEQRKAEAALRASEERHRVLAETMLQGVVHQAADGTIIAMNPAAERILGKTREELLGSSSTKEEVDTVREDRMPFPGMEHPAMVALRTGETVRGVVMGVFNPRQNERRWIAIDAVPLFRHGQTSPYQVYTVFEDITNRKRAEEALQKAKAELEQRVEERTAQLAQRAAQLRALASELTVSEQRERQRLSKILHDHLQQLLVAAKFRMTILGRGGDDVVKQAAKEVEDLMDESIAASRSLTTDLSPPILHQAGLTAGLQWLSRRMTERHGIFVELSTEEIGPLPEAVTILLFESVRELLFNAAKHSQARSAAVNLRRMKGFLQLVVSDHGIGFDPGAIKPPDESGGGFGLFTIQERLELLGGRLEIQSEPGKGSFFTLTMPIQEAVVVEHAPEEPAGEDEQITRPQPHPGTQPPLGARIRVMLVDDHTVMREGLSLLLSGEPDFEIIAEAANGREAVEMTGKLTPDVILMDVQMPIMGGPEATRIIHRDFPQTRIIGLSMFEESEKERVMLDAGAVSYLTKSGNADKLIAAIRNSVKSDEASPRQHDFPSGPGTEADSNPDRKDTQIGWD